MIDELFIDKAVSGKSTDRPEYDKMMDYVKINDIDMIKEFSGAIMKVHESVLYNLSNKQYSTVSDYIKELI